MKHSKLSIVILGACALLVVLLAACPNPISSSKGGVLTVSINNNINARTLLPPIDMNAASFTASGTGPGTATFSQTTSGAPVTFDGLAFGAWSVTVSALNSAGTLIGSGQATVTVHTGQTAVVSITVVPLTGNGNLELTVSWTASLVESASILASLTPAAGPSTPLSFSVTGNTASYSSTTIPSGYQTLTVQLLDSGMPVMGAVEVVRIVAGQTTTGSYAFANVNQPGGSVQVHIAPEMADPIPVSISGVPATVNVGGSMTATASVSDGTANVTYVWYLNGVSVGMGATYTLGSTVPAGYYRLDVTAYTADGTRAGSATASFQVTVAAPQSGTIVTVAGNGTSGYSGDGGPATAAQLSFPMGVAFDSSGNLYIDDTYNHRIRKVTLAGIISTIAGTSPPSSSGGFSGDGGPAVDAQLAFPSDIAVDSTGNLFIADMDNRRIRKIDPTGVISTVAGNGTDVYTSDGGLATTTGIGAPVAVAVDSSNNLYFSNMYVVRKVSSAGIISTVAGIGSQGFSGDGGPATSAELGGARGLFLDLQGKVFISDTWNNCIRSVSPGGNITTICGIGPHVIPYGNWPAGSFSGDGGQAILAALSFPIGIIADGAGDVYFSDAYNRRIRKIAPSGIISTIAGTGVQGYSGDGGPAILAKLSMVYKVALDSSNRLYVADFGNSCVRRIQ
jgi:hypothetical protein